MYHDPVTGDMLTTGEYISWKIQNAFRRWTMLIIILVVTALCWLTRNEAVLLWWNLAASLLAIIIEFIVGLAMLGQCKRDAVCLREVRAISQRMEQLAQVLLKDVTTIEEQLHIGTDKE